MHTSISKMETSVDVILAAMALVQTFLRITCVPAPQATMVKIVSIAAVKPYLVRTVERVNLIRLTHEVTPVNVPSAIMAKNVSTVVAIPILVGTVEHVNSSQVTPKSTHAAVGMASMEINVSIEMHVSHPLAETQELALEAITATHAIVDQASLELIANKKLDG